MIWRMCIRRINHFFYNNKRINPFCRFYDFFQYIYLYQSFNLFMEGILEMYRNFSWSVLCWDCIWFQSQLVRFTWKFTKTLEYVCICRFHLSCVRGKSAIESEGLFGPTTWSDEDSGDSAIFEMLAQFI